MTDSLLPSHLFKEFLDFPVSFLISAYVFSKTAFAEDTAVLKLDYPVGSSRGGYVVSYHYDGLTCLIDVGKDI